MVRREDDLLFTGVVAEHGATVAAFGINLCGGGIGNADLLGGVVHRVFLLQYLDSGAAAAPSVGRVVMIPERIVGR